MIVSCQQSNTVKIESQNCDNEIDSIAVIYYNSLFKPFSGVKCGSLTQTYIPDFKKEDEGILDAVIKDCNIINGIEEELLRLTPLDLPLTEDVRIAADIYYKNAIKMRVCISGMYASSIFLEGVPQNSNNRLLYLIKNNIGYYSWFGESVLDMMDELKDTSFVREPIIISPYYNNLNK